MGKYLDLIGLSYLIEKIQATFIKKTDIISADLIQDGITNKVYTSTEKSKLAGIASGAEVNVQVDWNVTDTSSDAYIQNKPTIPVVDVALTTSELDEAWGTVFGVTISFTIDRVTYQAEEGMTWEEWVASNYNIDGFIFDKKGFICTSDGNSYVIYVNIGVNKEDIIIEDYVYSLDTGRI